MSLCTVFFSWLCFSKSINSFNKGNCAQRSGIERRQTPGLGTLSSAVHVSFQVLWIDAQAPHRGEHCHFVYINQPSGHVKVTGSAKFLVGGSCTAREKKKFDPTRTMQGDRCDLTWLWAERGHHWLCSWDQHGISNCFVTGKTYLSFVWLNRTASMSGNNTSGTQHRKTTCKHAPACRDRAENHCDVRLQQQYDVE